MSFIYALVYTEHVTFSTFLSYALLFILMSCDHVFIDHLKTALDSFTCKFKPHHMRHSLGACVN